MELSDKFNDLPLDVRRIAIAIEIEARIRQHESEKDRIRASYLRDVNKVEELIKILRQQLKELEQEANDPPAL
jgi:hypothetical protein